MRGERKCGTCNWFEDQEEEAKARYCSGQWQGLCHFRMPATIAKDSQGWGSWHQKGPAAVRKIDWCSCWQPAADYLIDGRPMLPNSIPATITYRGPGKVIGDD